MPNWCSNSVAFYQKNKGTTMLEAFYADIQKYQNYKDPETSNSSSWVGHWLESNRIDTKNLYARGFFNHCELSDDHVRIDMETAWGPLPEIWDLMADKYDLAYVYISQEPGCEVYVNTDIVGMYFSTRYQLNYFEIENLDVDARTLAAHDDLLQKICEETMYFDSWEEVVDIFKPLVFEFEDIEVLNRRLEVLGISVYQYDYG